VPRADFQSRLDAFSWESVRHAYGLATDVPGLIRALQSADANVRSEALHELYGNIWHQGTVYDATAHVVPFLIELSVDETQPERREILRLLSFLASGSSYRDQHAHMKLLDHLKQRPDWESELEKERGWVRAATQAVAVGIPHYFDLLKNPDPRIREAATHLLGTLAERTVVDQLQLWRAIQVEADPVVRFSLLVAASMQALTNEQRQELTALFVTADDITRFGIAVALVRQPGSSEQVSLAISHLVRVLIDPCAFTRLEDSFWLQNADDSAASFAARALRSTPPAATTIDALLRALPVQDTQSALTMAETLLALIFEHPCKEGVRFAELNEVQKRLLRELLDATNLWYLGSPDRATEYGNTMGVFAAYGLPQRRSLLNDFVNGRAPAAPPKSGGRIVESNSGASETFTAPGASARVKNDGWLRRWLKRFGR